MDISVVVCTYADERYPDFREAVESVLDQTFESTELVLVIDGNPRVYDHAERDFGGEPNVSVHCNDENLGVSASRTKGARFASGDVVAFIDDDAVADPDWVAELVHGYQKADAVAVGGRMTGRWLRPRPWYLPTEFDWLVGITHDDFAEPWSEVRNTFESNISFEREVFLDLGGFDPNFGPDAESYSHSEGAEIGARLETNYDRGVTYNPNAIVQHKVFPERLRPGRLLTRAYQQGVSKRRLARSVPSGGEAESKYLQRLLGVHAPRRLKACLRTRSPHEAGQLVMLLVFTATVGIGYLVESVLGGDRD